MKLIILIAFLFFTKPVFAGNDITVNCSSSSCDVVENLPLFSETNIAPGFNSAQYLTVNNNRNASCYLSVKLENNQETISQLSDAILITIDTGAFTLSSLLNSTQPISLGTIPQNTSKQITFQSQFDQLSGNEYQGLVQNFEIDLNFECDTEAPLIKSLTINSLPESAVKDTPFEVSFSIQNANPNTNYHIKAFGGTGSSENNFQTYNGTTWLNFKGTNSGWNLHPYFLTDSTGNYNGTVTVRGKSSSAQLNNLTLRMVEFGSTSPYPTFDSNTKTILITNPSSTTTSSTTTTGSVGGGDNQPTPTPPIIQTSGSVLGDFDQVDDQEPPPQLVQPLPEVQPLSFEGDVAGTSNCTRYWLPILFLISFLFNMIYLRQHQFIVLPLFVSTAAYLIDRLMLESSCCNVNLLCRFYYLGHIASFALPLVFSTRLASTKK